MKKPNRAGLSTLPRDSKPGIHLLSSARRRRRGLCFHWFGRLKRTVMLESPLRGNPREEAFCEGSDPKGGRSKGSCFFPKGTFAKSPRADADPLLIPQSGSMSKNEIPIGQSAR